MYGIEAAVILLACAVAALGMWTAPVWMRALAVFAAGLWRQLERAGVAIEKMLGIR